MMLFIVLVYYCDPPISSGNETTEKTNQLIN